MNRLSLLAVGFATLISASTATAADIVIGVPDWPSAQATANIIKVVMEDRLKLSVDLQTASNEEIFQGMDDGSMHVHPEVWLPNQADLYAQYVEGRRSARLSPHGVDASQGVCTTQATAEKHKITRLSDLADPEIARIFDTNFDGKGEIWIGAADWASTKHMIERASEVGFDKTMALLQAPESVALATIDIASATGKPLVFYCYSPHHVFALHIVVRLEEEPQGFAVASGASTSDMTSASARPSGWNQARFHITYATALAEEAPKAAEFLRRMKLDSDTVTALTYALVVERQDPAEFAKLWVGQNRERVDQWVQ